MLLSSIITIYIEYTPQSPQLSAETLGTTSSEHVWKLVFEESNGWCSPQFVVEEPQELALWDILSSLVETVKLPDGSPDYSDGPDVLPLSAFLRLGFWSRSRLATTSLWEESYKVGLEFAFGDLATSSPGESSSESLNATFAVMRQYGLLDWR